MPRVWRTAMRRERRQEKRAAAVGETLLRDGREPMRQEDAVIPLAIRWGKVLLLASFVLHVGCNRRAAGENGDGPDAGEGNDSATDTNADIPGDPSTDEAAALFNREQVVEIRLSLPSETWEQLKIDAQDEQYTSANVTIMGQPFDNVGLRFKGAYGSLISCFEDLETPCPKLPMKIKFNEYVEEQRFMGLKRINLQSWKWDQTRMTECLAFDIFQGMGIAAPRCAWAYVYVNDKALGLFGMVEQVDGRFTKSRFTKGDGNLFKEAWPNGMWGYGGDNLKTNQETADLSVIEAFGNDMMNSDDETGTALLSKWMDLDYFSRYMAVDFALANWDGITTFYCSSPWECYTHNFYLYQEETRPYFWIVPWDLEATLDLYNWNEGQPQWDDFTASCDYVRPEAGEFFIRPASCDPILRAIVLYDREPYFRALHEVLDNHLAEEVITARIESIAALIAPYVEADPDIDTFSWREAITWQYEELEKIRARVQGVL